MRQNLRRNQLPLMALTIVGLLSMSPAGATNPVQPKPSPPAMGNPFNELKSLEKRFFFHEYDHDPLEKRLERIELLVFGSAQAGEGTARLSRIKAAVVNRDREAAQRLTEKNKELKTPAPTAPSTTAPTSSQQYPILQTLEWRALQKTYGGETLDQRLDRLETSLLGQPSPAMSYADRIERLKKMIGVETASTPSPRTTPLPRGPLPKASAKRSPFNSPYITPLPRGNWDDEDEKSFEDDFQNQMNNDLQTMMDMMQRMQRSPGFRSPGGMMPFNGRSIVIPPGAGDGSSIPYAVPIPAQPKKPKLPPYADPNSI